MSGSHNGQPPAPDARYSESTCYDLTPPDALHPLTDIAALRLEVAALADADVRAALGEAERTSPSVVSARTEERLSALEDAVHRQAQMLQVLWLEREGRQ